MADVESLEGTYKMIKASFDAIHKFIAEFREGDNIKALSVRKQKLVERCHSWDETYVQLNSISPGVYTKEYLRYSDLYFDMMADIETIIDRHQKPATKSSNTLMDVKLPDIVLPKFNGEYSEWTAFIDIFNSLIHNNSKLSPVQKLHYLKGALTSSALELISTISITNENYEIAYNLVVKTFSNKLLIINAHLQSIENIRSIHKGSFENLRALLNGARQQVQSLKAFFEPAEHWDIVLLHMLSRKLDSSTKVAWNLSRASGQLPTLVEFFTFLELRVTALEHSCSSDSKPTITKSVHTIVKKPAQLCSHCKEDDHMLYQCSSFKALDIKARKAFINKLSICSRCLASRHNVAKCKFRYTCTKCKEPHNALLHEEPEPKPSTSSSTVCMASTGMQTLLSTVSLVVIDSDGTQHKVRALLDSGSQINLITTSLLAKLKCPVSSSFHKLSMLQGQSVLCDKSVKLTIKSRVGVFARTINCVAVDRITQLLPSAYIEYDGWKIPDHVSLADPMFNVPGAVDMLIGVELYFEVLQQGCIRLGNHLPILRKSCFGWLISGVYASEMQSRAHVGFISNEDLHDSLTKFWQLEEVSSNYTMTGSDKACEDHFIANVARLENGQFEVALPFVDNQIDKLGSSFAVAKYRFLNLERRFAKDNALFTAYSNFVKAYIDLGHAEEMVLTLEEAAKNKYYFLPHHPVVKDNNFDKIRVVFDASAKSTSGISLNNILHTGPKLQQDLFSILVRFRCHQFVFVADIIKMYRQIRVREADQNYQIILWRETPQDTLKFFKLTTVTYGTASAPYLAMRCLKMLAQNNMTTFTQAALAIEGDCYVDDIITGADSAVELVRLQRDVVELLGKGGFSLHKWSSNCREVLRSVPKENQSSAMALFSEVDTVKTLGLAWNPCQDCFKISHIKVGETEVRKGFDTKRSVLSTIAQIYDPIGLISPVSVTAKLIMQELWRQNLGWDESLPQELQDRWVLFKRHLADLDNLIIPRKIFDSIPVTIQCHGFSDASLYAYGACIYLRATYADGTTSSRLLCSKSKVAPLKNVTLPRLELSAALLLAKLYRQIMTITKIQISESFLWCDSTIVLAWLKTDPALLKMFVSNRVAEILDLTPGIAWRHVGSKDNSADIVSRGVKTPLELVECNLWWNGPAWLVEESCKWPNRPADVVKEEAIPERRVLAATEVNIDDSFLDHLVERFSKFNKIVRVVAYCFRWFKIFRSRKPDGQPVSDVLSVDDLREASRRIFYLAQRKVFGNIPDQLMSGELSSTSLGKLKALNPFVDAEGLLRVGGRLENADISYDQKHPIILPKANLAIDIFIRSEHERLLHAGTQTTLANIRLKYWPIDGRNTVKRIIHKCVKCARFRATCAEQLMGSLPKDRVTAYRPFQIVGVDFAGPVLLRASRLRKAPRIKAYISLFVCMATKAIHIELVSGLSTDAFLSALRRFISRRGCCSVIHSDNGRNFVGAKSELRQLATLFQSDKSKGELITASSNLGITWQFTPSHAPHFGGLWEGSIKVMKHHIRRIIGSHCLTFEEYTTLLCQIEAVLNSRPILALTDDSTDIAYISPGHFIIGSALTAFPEPFSDASKVKPIKLFKQISSMRDQFWSLWSKQYLNDLQKRNKWTQVQPNINLNAIVLLKEDNLPPLHWPVGRVIDTKPGQDGKVRVVTVKTSSGTYTRPVTKIVILPCQ
ncbi:uncharacterized protein LOC113375440 [Ctenocephalides felis]|uniref:uncharacterized protein LOC113375440 n=1 Tax=Ctenocephalides felis TaxID=7515 RepID=UPI000E6E198C|nr:uncharacterized protein LOC113375440 [Ctenocephalides felis]